MARGESSREKILTAASELAMSDGAAHLSLDSVAARAGVSKGGLLYNFPNKSALMRALVQRFLDEFRAELDENADQLQGNDLAARYLDQLVRTLDKQSPPSSGLLAALAEDPCLLMPVRTFNRELLDRMLHETPDPGAVLTLFLVLEGMRAQQIFGTDILGEEERRLVLEKIASMIGAA